MCGISGILSPRPIDPMRLEVMTRRLAHRGPDGEGTWIGGRNGLYVGLGHRRLAIVDLSDAGRQPMANEDGRLVIVFNGEIYNHEELRADLGGRHPFRSRCDTEVLLHGWEEEGSAFLDRVDGMFAFALWDARDGSLTLGRDRIGEKPLLYAALGDELLFASELGAISADAAFPHEMDPEALDHYLTWNAIPAPWTIFRAARRLSPGHLIRVTPEKRIETTYWIPTPAADPPADEKEAALRLRAGLEASVRRRLSGDVPVGAFLSGGIDSSVIVGLAARVSSSPLRTFTVGFDGQTPFDERAFAREVACLHGTLHTEIVLDPRESISEIASLLSELDEPFADSSAVPTSLVSRQAGFQVKVALSGDGADELFAGYWKYVSESIAPAYARVPERLRSLVAAWALRLPEDRRSAASESLRRVRKFLTRFDPDPIARCLAWMRVMGKGEKSELLLAQDPNLNERTEGLVERLYREAGTDDILASMLCVDLRHTLPTDMLTKVDRMSMRHGLEIRVPYLDPAIVSLALALPSKWKLKGMRRKAILLDACADLLPRHLLRRPKRGFEVPMGEWFRGPLREMLEDTLSEPFLARQAIFHPSVVRRLLDEHMARRGDHTSRLWSLLVFCAWQRRIRSGPAHPPA